MIGGVWLTSAAAVALALAGCGHPQAVSPPSVGVPRTQPAPMSMSAPATRAAVVRHAPPPSPETTPAPAVAEAAVAEPVNPSTAAAVWEPPAVIPDAPPSIPALPPAPSPASASGAPAATLPIVLMPGAIKMIQQRLSNAGILPEVDGTGKLDAMTHSALMRFQDANQLPPTGEPDDATVRKLGLDPYKIFDSGSAAQ